MHHKKFLAAVLIGLILQAPFYLPASVNAVSPADVKFSVDTGASKHSISRYIYGNNIRTEMPGWDGAAHNLTMTRFGGNRATTYNWENNASNAGSDWQNQSDGYLGGGNVPGGAVKDRVSQAFNAKAGAIVTIPMQGYVAKDKNADGDVSNSPDYLNTRFIQSLPRKNKSFSLKPNTNDNAAYQDEFVNWLTKTFPNASSDPNKKILYSLDNEPDLWSSTHPKIQPAPATYESLKNKTIDFARAIKDVDPKSTILGPVNYGWNGFMTLQNASDCQGRNFLDYYLQAMKKAENQYGKRLVDALDVHWYPEAQGGGRRIISDDSDDSIAQARMQAPRSLWDPSYVEDSWIADSVGGPIALLPMLKDKISKGYSGTKLAMTEYYYGGGAHISGGIAQADVLGIFGRENVYAANLWHMGNTDDKFIYGAFDLYRNYDGKGGSFGDISVSAVTSDNNSTSVYASLDSKNPNRMVMVVINKEDKPVTAQINIKNDKQLSKASAYELNSDSAALKYKGEFKVENGNVMNYTMPALSVTTLVFDISNAAAISLPGTQLNAAMAVQSNTTQNVIASAFDVWWPTNLATISGEQPFKVMIPGKNISDYKMYWQVDGGKLNPMYDSYEGYQHKEAWADVSNWHWKGSGPYAINFVAKDYGGNIIGQRSVSIMVQ